MGLGPDYPQDLWV